MLFGLRRLMAPIFALGLAWTFAPCAVAGLIETNVFAEQGVDVDVTAATAAAAKDQALMDVQVKAFNLLAKRLGGDKMAADIAKWKPADIAPYLKSLSIEKENTGPGRYIGIFTVRFLPAKMSKLFDSYGVHVPTDQASPIIVLPLFKGPQGPQLWEDNPWRSAWLDLHGEQAVVPIVVPLGDLDDSSTLNAADALTGDPVKLEALRRRYGAPSLLLAVAEPADNGGLHVTINGDTKLGKVLFDKVYTGDDGTLPSAAAAAVRRIDEVLTNKFMSDQAKAAAAAAGPQTISVSIGFNSPTQWNGIRSRILATPGVSNVDLSTLNVDGAVVRLTFTGQVSSLQQSMLGTGLTLAQAGQNWIIQPR